MWHKQVFFITRLNGPGIGTCIYIEYMSFLFLSTKNVIEIIVPGAISRQCKIKINAHQTITVGENVKAVGENVKAVGENVKVRF